MLVPLNERLQEADLCRYFIEQVAKNCVPLKYMTDYPYNRLTDVDAQFKQLLDFIDSFPLFSPEYRTGLKSLFTELAPHLRSRNKEQIHNLIDARRNIAWRQIDENNGLRPERKEHAKNGVRIQADMLKWLLDEIFFVPRA